MKKAEFIQEVTNIAKENGAKVSQELVKVIMETMEVVTDGVIENGDTVSYNGIKFGSKEVAAREGIINMEGDKKGQKWTTPPMEVGYCKFLDSKRKSLSKEI